MLPDVDSVDEPLVSPVLVGSTEPLPGMAPLPPVDPIDLRLLVVEDDQFVRTATFAMLESISQGIRPEDGSAPIGRFRMSVEFASSGEEGWDRLIDRGNFDIALVDIHLPGVSGLSLAWTYQQTLLERGVGAPWQVTTSPQQTILIACTCDPEASIDQLNRHGMHDVLRKPFTLTSLRHILHKWMPRDAPPTTTLLHQPAQLRHNRSGIFAGRVLLVEDCEVTRMASDLVFQQLGLHIDTAEDGESATDQLRRRDYDLVLLDVNLPSMSSYALCSWCVLTCAHARRRCPSLYPSRSSGVPLTRAHSSALRTTHVCRYKEMCREEGRSTGFVVAVTSEPDLEACHEFGFDLCRPKPLSTPEMISSLLNYWRYRTSDGERATVHSAL